MLNKGLIAPGLDADLVVLDIGLPGMDGYEVAARIRERLDAPALLFPLRREVEKDLEDAAPLRKGIEQMIAPAGSEQDRAALEALLRQLEEYEAFVRAGVLPRAREDQRLPRDLYAHLLVSNGIEASPEELLELGREGLRETEAALQQAAQDVRR